MPQPAQKRCRTKTITRQQEHKIKQPALSSSARQRPNTQKTMGAPLESVHQVILPMLSVARMNIRVIFVTKRAPTLK